MITAEFLIVSALGKSCSPRDFLFLLHLSINSTVSPIWAYYFIYQTFQHSMFAHLVTAAKGLFTRQPEEQESHLTGTSTATNAKMVTSTRRGVIAPEGATGKRKAQVATAGKTEAQQTKRRRRSDPKVGDGNATTNTPAKTFKATAEKAPAGKKIRFGSEDPEPLETQPEEVSETPIQDDDDEDDSDDDAPETIDNSAQLLKMKEQAKKQEAAKQLYV
jgi:U3 small nucleolar RNA-associated protein 16